MVSRWGSTSLWRESLFSKILDGKTNRRIDAQKIPWTSLISPLNNTNQMDKPSNEIMAIICSLAANALQQNKNWEDAIETHGYMAEMEYCNKEKESLKLLDEWIDQVEAE